MNEIPENQIVDVEVVEQPGKTCATVGPSCWMKNYGNEATEVFCRSSAFFDSMSRTGGYVEPTTFLGISAGIYALIQAVCQFNPLLLFTLFVGSVVKTAVGAFIGYQVLKAMGGKGSLEATFRVLAYSKVTLLVAWISVGILPIGGFVSIFYGVYLNILGCSKVHEIGKMKAGIALMLMAAIGYVVAMMFHI